MSSNIILENSHVRLIPLNKHHKEALFSASQDKNIWTWMIDSGIGRKDFDRYFKAQLQQHLSGAKRIFTVQLPGGSIIGLTSYLNTDTRHRRIEVGSTWYHPDTWGTIINPATKFLLFQHAFETLNMNRVALCTDLLNLRSQRAIEKIGAKKEGILRSHMLVQDGRIRDSVLYSITKADWDNSVKNLLFSKIKVSDTL